MLSTGTFNALLALPFLSRNRGGSARRIGLALASYVLSLLLTVLSFCAVSASILTPATLTDRYFAPALLVYALYSGAFCCARMLLCAKWGVLPLSQKQRLACAALLLLCLCVMLEFFLFNLRHYRPVLHHAQVQYHYSDSLQAEGTHTLDECGNIIIGAEGALLHISEIGVPVYSVHIGIAEPREAHFDFRVGLYDEANTQRPRESSIFIAHTDSHRSRNVAIESHGAMRALEVRFLPNADGLAISFLAVNLPPDFAFLPLRVLGLFALLLTLMLLKSLKLSRLRYNPKSTLHKGLTALLAAVMAGFGLFTVYTGVDPALRESGNALDTAYLPGAHYDDVYHQMFAAYHSGQLTLKIEADEKLVQLKNPYDPSERDRRDVPYEWDRAYYNGSYYSYFGVAPLLSIHLPYYALTNRLPTSETASYIISLFFIAGTVLLYRRLLAYYRLRPPLLLYLAGLLALLLGSNVFWCLRQSFFYEVAAIYGITAVVWLFYALLRARGTGKTADFALCGVPVVLIAASRPNMLLYCLLALPLLWGFLRDARRSLRQRVLPLIAFGLIVAGGAAGIMAYNFFRFGSVLEFGANFQLTVSDIRYNTPLNLYNIFPALYHYLFQPPRLSFDFPYFERAGYPPVTLHNYYFRWATTGALFFPLTWFGAGAWVRRRHEIAEKAVLRRMLPILALVCVYLTFSMGGAHYRYSTDFLFFLMLAGILELLRAARPCIRDYGEPAFRLLLFVLLFTAFLAMLLTFSGENGIFLHRSPEWYLRLKYSLEWFR